MKPRLIIGFFITLCAVLFVFSEAKAEKPTPATHLWVQNYENLLYVPARSLEHCKMLVKQAAMINSSQGLCYMNDKLIKRIECVKPVKKDGKPKCS